VWVAVLVQGSEYASVLELGKDSERYSEPMLEQEMEVVLAEDSVKERAMEWALALEVESETTLGNLEVSPSQRK